MLASARPLAMAPKVIDALSSEALKLSRAGFAEKQGAASSTSSSS